MILSKYALFITIFLLQSYLIRFQVGPYPSNLLELLILVTGVLFLYDLHLNKKLAQTVKKLSKHWLILSLAALTAASTLINYYSGNIGSSIDLIRHLKFFVFGGAVAIMFLEILPSEKEKREGLTMMGLGALTFGIFSLLYNAWGYNPTHDIRLLGPLDSAVYLAYYLTPFFLFFSIEAIENRQNKMLKIFAVLFAVLIVATKSMGAIGGSFIVLALYLIKQGNFLKSRRNKLILALATLIIASTIFYAKILPTINTPWSSLDERGEIWQTAGRLLQEPTTVLFGKGPSQFEYHYQQTVDLVLDHQALDYNIIQPHNHFLLFQFHYGILGLALLIFLLISNYKNIRDGKGKSLQTLANFILIYFFIHGLIDTPWYKNDILPILLIIASIAIPQAPSIRRQIR
jgi:hypothetical protein